MKKRAIPGRPPPRGPRYRHDKMPRVMILSPDPILGNLLRTEMRRLLREPWFAYFGSIFDYRDSIHCNIIHDLVVHCPGSRESPEEIKEAIGRILFYCREAKIVLYTAGRENVDDHRIAETVIKPDIDGLAAAIERLLRKEAA